MRLRIAISLAAATLATAGSFAAETVLFEENFETDSSANWTVHGDSPTDTPDHDVRFAFDYSTQRYVANGVTNFIPAAPNSASGGTRGVKLSVNKTGTAEPAGVSLYPNGKSFSGNYALRADVWMNYNGPAFGGTGSTEYSTFGINHDGTRANWDSTEAVGDGLWFGMTGEGGAAQDYRALEWDGASVVNLRTVQGGLIGEDHGAQVFQERFPSPLYESAGAPGKRWVEVEVQQREGNIIWKINGYVIGERANTTGDAEGNIMIGAMDTFASLAVPGEDNYVIFDNVRVVQLDATILPGVTIAATDGTASEPGTDTATLTVTRTGDTGAALTVPYRVLGTADTNDYAALSGSVTIPAGQTSADITVTVVNDPKAETEEILTITLLGSVAYELRGDITATVTIADDNDQAAVSLAPLDPWAYEGITNDLGSFRITRVGDLNTDLSVNLSFSGTAQPGMHYLNPGTFVSIPAGATSAVVNIVPIDNTAADSNRTVTLTLATGSGYTIATPTNFTVTIRDDEGMAPGTVVFSDNFDTDTSANWRVNEAHLENNRATFNYDYSAVGIPPAPNTTNGTTRGLKLEANVGTPTFTGLSVSPVGQGFVGDYRLGFDMWINYNGPLPAGGAGSTMSFAAGVGTSGEVAQFPGTSVEGVLFSATGEGGSGSDWRAYVATGAPLANTSGAYAAGTGSTVLNNTDPYYAPFGRVAAPEAQLALYPEQTGITPTGGPGIAWHEVVIEKRGTNISWFVDNLRIATITLTNKEISTNIFVGFFDINATQTGNQDLSFGLVDNLRVETLSSAPTGEVRITAVRRNGQNIEIDFTADGFSSFVVEGSAVVNGAYAPEGNAQITTVSGNLRRATIPLAAGNRFFRVRGQ